MIEANWKSSYHVGACSACQRHATPHGTAAHQVCEIHLSSNDYAGTIIRVCHECAAELAAKLKGEPVDARVEG